MPLQNREKRRYLMTNIPYFSLLKNDEKKEADIVIFGDIVSKTWADWNEIFPADVSSYDLVHQLGEIPEDYAITVHINSYGGEVKEGLAIYNALKRRNVTTICEGFAASAASIIFMGGQRRIMNAASLLFIHQALTRAEGNPDELEKAADDLRIITDAAANAYREGGVKIPDEQLMKMLKAETWIEAEDAVEMGFATEVAGAATENDGVPTNSAMASIIAAVTRPNSTLGTISIDNTDLTNLEQLIDRLTEQTDRIVEMAMSQTQQPKGFFKF